MPYSVDGKEPATAVLDPELFDCRDLAGGSGRSMGCIWSWRVGSDDELPPQTGKRVPWRSCRNPVDNADVGETLGWPKSIFAIRQDPQIRVLSSTAASENGLHPHLCIRIQVSHHGECLAAALRCLDAPGENPRLMPLGRPSTSCFNECTSRGTSAQRLTSCRLNPIVDKGVNVKQRECERPCQWIESVCIPPQLPMLPPP